MAEPSTTDRGTAFENEVLAVLKLLPNTSVSAHVRIAGKDADIVSESEDVFGVRLRIAFECKDFSKPLTREQVTKIIADYQPLLSKGLIARFCLVTRKGIVANAREAFAPPATQHLTYSELLDRLVSPRELLVNMRERFFSDRLNDYYVDTRCAQTDIEWISRNYASVYNPFIDFILSAMDHGRLPSYSLRWAAEQWNHYAPLPEFAHLPRKYSEEMFSYALHMRSPDARFSTPLEELVLAWADNDKIEEGLALLGSYGTGKSSFARRLAYVWAKRFEDGLTSRLPLLIELRDFGSHQDIRGLITHELVNRHGVAHGSFDCFQLLNRSRKFLLILDGFDEMKHGMSKDALLFNFNELNKLVAPGSKVLLCGRPTAFASDAEQTTLLAGRPDAYLTHSARYIQITMAPFTTEDTVRFLTRYLATQNIASDQRAARALKNLPRLLNTDPYLANLLSRPVHLPMLASILPEWDAPIEQLRRPELYRLFIRRTIAREMLKRGDDETTGYSVDARQRFATELALRMFIAGESRSIRYTEISDDLIRPFVRPGQTIDATRRDLVTACFLERKPPDILYFGHKSFAEYLVAERFVTVMQQPEGIASIPVPLTPEILAFMLELATRDQLLDACANPIANVQLLFGILEFMNRGHANELGVRVDNVIDVLTDSRCAGAIAAAVDVLPRRVAARLVHFYEPLVSKAVLRENRGLLALLQTFVSNSDEEIAVHAYRALATDGNFDKVWLRSILGAEKLKKWRARKWIV